MRRTATTWLPALALAVPLLGCDPGGAGAPRAAPHSSATRDASTTPSPTAASQPAARVVTSRVAVLPAGLSRTVAVRRGHDVLLLGGLTTGDVTTGRVWRLDPTTGRTTTAGALAEAVHDASGAVLDGAAVVFGGGAATEVTDVQRWTSGTAQPAGHLPSGRSDSAAVVVRGVAYVVGGFDGSSLSRDVLATRDGRSFRVAGRLRPGVRYPAVATLGAEVYVVGGDLATTAGTTGGPQTRAIQRFDPATGRTAVIGHLPRPLGHAMAFTLDGRLFVAGGRSDGVASASIWAIDPASGRVRRAGHLPGPRSDAAVVPVGRAALLVGGELTGPLAPLRSVVRVRLDNR